MQVVQDTDFTLYCGDVLDVLRTLPDGSVHCCLTSPPYWGLRDYGTGSWEGGDADCDHTPKPAPRSSRPAGGLTGGKATVDAGTVQRDLCHCGARRVDKQLGLEPTPEEYVANMVAVFREVRRVLRADGTCWINIGDSYATSPKGNPDALSPSLNGDGRAQRESSSHRGQRSTVVSGLKPKDLVGIPWRLAFALQADGWYLRADIIWAKPNPMPESVTDRPTKAHEYVFLLSKSPRYFFDQEAVRERYLDGPGLTGGAYSPPGQSPHGNARGPDGRRETRVQGANGSIQHRDGERWPNGGRNIRSVWEIATQPYPEAHFATFPEALVDRIIRAGTSERGCCPVCGAPWERETERGVPPREVAPSEIDRYGTGEAGVHRKVGGQYQKWLDENPKQTTGWRPACDCGDEQGVIGQVGPVAHEPIPCTVLDPFIGSGTTALVARRLGRHTIGIELNPDYCQLAARRLQQLSLLAVDA